MKINKKKTYLVQQTILIKIAKSSAPLIHSSVLNFSLGHFHLLFLSRSGLMAESHMKLVCETLCLTGDFQI